MNKISLVPFCLPCFPSFERTHTCTVLSAGAHVPVWKWCRKKKKEKGPSLRLGITQLDVRFNSNNRVKRVRLPVGSLTVSKHISTNSKLCGLALNPSCLICPVQSNTTDWQIYTKSTFISFRGKVIKIPRRACDWQEIPVDLAYYCWWGRTSASEHVPTLIGWNRSQIPTGFSFIIMLIWWLVFFFFFLKQARC